MYRKTTSLADILRLALPAGTRVLAGAGRMMRPVTWACSLRPSPPAFPNLTGGELALVDMDDLRLLDPRQRLDRVVHSLRQARVAAIAVRGDAPASSLSAAEACDMPLLALPLTASLVEVERTVIRFIVDREGYVAALAADLQRELTQIQLDGGDLQAIACRLNAFAGEPLVFMRADGSVAASAGLEPEEERARVLASLPNATALRTWAIRHTRDEHVETGVLKLSSSHPTAVYVEAAVAPVLVGERLEGYCLVLRSNHRDQPGPSVVEALAARQGADAAALEWTRQQALGAAQERMQAAFVDELLASPVADEEAWVQRGLSLGYDLTQPHTAWMVTGVDVPAWPTPLFKFVREQRVPVPASRRGEAVVLFWPGDNPKSGRTFKQLAATFVDQVVENHPRSQVTIGIGRPAVQPSEWVRSLQQARESWHMGRSWWASPVTYFGDLGLYQLLSVLATSPEANRFFRKSLQPLIDHDENRNAELVETLDAFFRCHGNLSQTAARLHIHRNTLTYRLERIAAITRLDLDDPDARFILQLALKLRPVMERGGPPR
ncbi:MAG: hypothetical protein D6790_19820 [Caldilineae bacterium]|nr:MAG: hypothetical protein D6790_19820 [Caldilineae bacterium]